MLWRLRAEFGGDAGREKIQSVERRAGRGTGYLLYALAVYVAASSVHGLAVGHRAGVGESIWGLAIGVIAIVAMPWLAYYKRRLASLERLNSKSLRADAAEAVSCAYLSAVLVVGLLLSRLLGWWWPDSVAALVLIPFIVIEDHEAMSEKSEVGDD